MLFCIYSAKFSSGDATLNGDLLKAKASKMGEYNKVISRASELFFGTPTATKDVEPMLEGGCEFAGHTGNVAFFVGQGTTRNQKTLDAEIQKAFITMGVLFHSGV